MAIKYITLISCFFLSFWGIDSLIDAEIEKFVVHPDSKSSNETDDDVPMVWRSAYIVPNQVDKMR